MRILLTMLAMFMAVSCTTVAEKKAKVVFLHGSRSHASGDHEFKAGSHLLAKHIGVYTAVAIELGSKGHDACDITKVVSGFRQPLGIASYDRR